jgi:AraC-like DNA-binding protein
MAKIHRNQLGLEQRTFGMTYVRTWATHRFDLMSLGYETRKVGCGYDWPCHNRAESVLFQYTLDGEGCFEIDGSVQSVKVGQALLIPVPAPVRYFVGRDCDWEFVWCMLSGDGTIALCQQLVSQVGMVLSLPLHCPPVQQCVDLYKRLNARRKADVRLDEYAVNQLVHHWCLSLRQAVLEPVSSIPEEVALVQYWMNEQLSDSQLRVESLAQAAGYSRFHFSRLFREAVGVSPYQYLMQLRMRKALELLTTTDMPIKQIAPTVGFEEVTWFTTTFKKHIGQTPGGVRKEQRDMGWSEAVRL